MNLQNLFGCHEILQLRGLLNTHNVAFPICVDCSSSVVDPNGLAAEGVRDSVPPPGLRVLVPLGHPVLKAVTQEELALPAEPRRRAVHGQRPPCGRRKAAQLLLAPTQ